MNDPTILISIRQKFSEAKFPQLYSKRGFEKSRIRFIIPPDRTQLAYATDKNGTRLIIEI
jgi:hypothetical protein